MEIVVLYLFVLYIREVNCVCFEKLSVDAGADKLNWHSVQIWLI